MNKSKAKKSSLGKIKDYLAYMQQDIYKNIKFLLRKDKDKSTEFF